MAVARRLESLTRDTLDEVSSPCRTCTRAVLTPVQRNRVEAERADAERAGGVDAAAEAKAAWLSGTLLDWGSCGLVVRADGRVVGHALYAPAAYLPGLASYATAPIAPDAVALAELRVDPAYADGGLARMLVQGMAADLARRGVRAIEAISSARGDDPCLVPADFLLAVGFTTARPHPRTPRMRLDLRSSIAWREDLIEAALDRLFGGRHRVGTLHRGDPAS